MNIQKTGNCKSQQYKIKKIKNYKKKLFIFSPIYKNASDNKKELL